MDFYSCQQRPCPQVLFDSGYCLKIRSRTWSKLLSWTMLGWGNFQKKTGDFDFNKKHVSLKYTPKLFFKKWGFSVCSDFSSIKPSPKKRPAKPRPMSFWSPQNGVPLGEVKKSQTRATISLLTSCWPDDPLANFQASWWVLRLAGNRRIPGFLRRSPHSSYLAPCSSKLKKKGGFLKHRRSYRIFIGVFYLPTTTITQSTRMFCHEFYHPTGFGKIPPNQSSTGLKFDQPALPPFRRRFALG